MLKKLFQRKSGESEAIKDEVVVADVPVEATPEEMVDDEPTPLEEPPTEPVIEESGEEPSAEAQAKKGFLRGAWEATKKLALTPVDPWFEAVAKGLDRTRQNLVNSVVSLLRIHKRIDDELWDELEDILITSDVGSPATERIIKSLRQAVKDKKLTQPEQLLGELKIVLQDLLVPVVEGEEPLPVPTDENADDLKIVAGQLNVILMVGVNGTGKTTTTAKLTHRFRQRGLKVLLAAADTFRAAAIEQLEVWGKRLNVDVIRHNEGSDPAAVVYDAIQAAKARKMDVLIVDTAGRLHSKINLMEELRKIKKVLAREEPGAPQEILLVLDATTGQNAVNQARVFHEVVDLTGLVLCKLDGTAKGGIVVAIAQEFKIPVRFIGVGEGIEDLKPFRPEPFLKALFGDT
jgi:fused signal recognition particle receptor